MMQQTRLQAASWRRRTGGASELVQRLADALASRHPGASHLVEHPFTCLRFESGSNGASPRPSDPTADDDNGDLVDEAVARIAAVVATHKNVAEAHRLIESLRKHPCGTRSPIPVDRRLWR